MAIIEQDMNIPRFAKRLMLLFFPALFLLLAISYNTYQSEVTANRNIVSERELLTISQHEKELEDRFKDTISDLFVLSEDRDLRHILNDPDNDLEEHISTLNFQFPSFITHKKVYDQIRLITQAGQEIIRIDLEDGKPKLALKEELQNKANRYYFRETMALEPGNIFISPFDLNVEHGEIEKPLKPMIRFGIPVIDYEGNKRGILILNFLGDNLLKGIEGVSTTSMGKAILLNSEGYWLKGLKPEDEWGFMYQDRKDRLFSAQYSDAWKRIDTDESGQFVNADGMFTFITVRPLSDYRSIETVSSNYYWKLISFIPSETLNQYANNLKRTATILIVLLTLIWLIACIIITYGREKNYLNELSIKEKDARIREIVTTAFDGIITINEKGIIESINPAACKIFGYQEQEVIGKSMNIIIPSRHEDVHDNYIKHYVQSGDYDVIAKPRELNGKRKDGTIFPMDLCIGAKQFGIHWMFTGIIRDITERKALESNLEKMATTDALTGIYNRGYFNKALDDEYKRSIRYTLSLSLIILDADHFKSVNDDHGHPAGDAFLIALAKQIEKIIREVDIAARYGGEEFIIILPQTSGSDAMAMAERLREAIEEMEITYEDQTISRTVSIGVASLPDVQVDSAGELLKAADSALYRAKDSGRNRVVQAE